MVATPIDVSRRNRWSTGFLLFRQTALYSLMRLLVSRYYISLLLKHPFECLIHTTDKCYLLLIFLICFVFARFGYCKNCVVWEYRSWSIYGWEFGEASLMILEVNVLGIDNVLRHHWQRCSGILLPLLVDLVLCMAGGKFLVFFFFIMKVDFFFFALWRFF